ncbi:MAG TPA: efflux RND transporter periplasmic adaptor subunit [Terriglobales bacterium]|nr:efflux RND transporter periplasmic adaptor subunit [Terriglobales bacterium]
MRAVTTTSNNSVATIFARKARSWRGAALACLLAATALPLLSACEKSPAATQAAAAPAPKVSVADVLIRPVTEWDEVTGRLEAPDAVTIRPRVSGYIDQVAFKEGAMVKKGDLLFQIDPRPFQDEVNRLQAQLEQAKATQIRTASEMVRGNKLFDNKVIGSEENDARNAAAAEARAAVAATQAQLETAKLNLSFTQVRAPIDGRVSRADLTEGNLVNADQSVLTTLVSTDRVYVYFDVDERVYLKYVDMQHKGELTAAPPVYLALSNEDGFPHLGQLDFVDNQVNAKTGTIRGRAVFDNRNGDFTPGLYARVRLVGSPTYDAALIDDAAVGTDLGKKFVLVLTKDGKVGYRGIELGPKLDGLRVVRTGLEKGDKIVVKGLQRVRPGMPVDAEMVPMADQATLDHQEQMLATNSAKLLQEQQQASGLQQSTAAGSSAGSAIGGAIHN